MSLKDRTVAAIREMGGAGRARCRLLMLTHHDILIRTNDGWMYYIYSIQCIESCATA